MRSQSRPAPVCSGAQSQQPPSSKGRLQRRYEDHSTAPGKQQAFNKGPASAPLKLTAPQLCPLLWAHCQAHPSGLSKLLFNPQDPAQHALCQEIFPGRSQLPFLPALCPVHGVLTTWSKEGWAGGQDPAASPPISNSPLSRPRLMHRHPGRVGSSPHHHPAPQTPLLTLQACLGTRVSRARRAVPSLQMRKLRP